MDEFLDPAALAAAMSLTVITVAVVFLADTFVRTDRPAGRIWAFAFFALGVSSLGRVAEFSLDSEAWLATAFGDACFVAFFGAFWTGSRRFNGGRPLWPAAISAVIAIGVFGASLGATATGIDIVRMLPLLAGTAFLAGCAGVESRRRRMARKETLLLTISLAVVVFFSLAASVIQLVPDPQAPVGAADVFNASLAAVITMPVAVVALATTMVLRAGDRLGLAQQRAAGELRIDPDGLLDAASLEQVVELLARRAERSGERVAVLAMVSMALPEIGAALGATAQEELERVWRASWAEHLPLGAIPGEAGKGCLALVLSPAAVGEANRIGNRIYGRVVEDLARVEGVVLPVTGLGLAMSGTVPASDLIATARNTARRSASGIGAGRPASAGDDIVERTLPPRG